MLRSVVVAHYFVLRNEKLRRTDNSKKRPHHRNVPVTGSKFKIIYTFTTLSSLIMSHFLFGLLFCHSHDVSEHKIKSKLSLVSFCFVIESFSGSFIELGNTFLHRTINMKLAMSYERYI